MGEEQINWVEKRSAKRANAKFKISYSLPHQKGPPCTATTIDISSKSVAFECHETLEIGAKLSGEFVVPFLPKPIKYTGHVKRIEELVKGERYLHAIIFDQISEQDRVAIEEYVQSIDINHIARLAIKKNASDIHFVANKPYFFRIHGELVQAGAYPISAKDLKEMLLSMLTPQEREEFAKNLELDFSFTIPEGNHFRVNIHLEKGNLEAAFRVIAPEIKTILDLDLPPVVEALTKKKKGLIIVTGPAGSGKTTTQAAMIDAINDQSAGVIISIEDPIEYVHECKKSIVKQREVGADTLSFANAIKHALRQDPNVIFIGEMRDLESISMALTAAETGHLVLTTLHTIGAAESMNRMADVYPPEQQPQILSQLAACLEGIISQVLLPKKDGSGRVLATEILIATPAIRNLIRTGKMEQIASYFEAGTESGMQSLDRSILNLYREGAIDEKTALSFARNPDRMKNFLRH